MAAYTYKSQLHSSAWGLPPQMVSTTEKENPEWGKACMDFFDYQASAQIKEKYDDLRKYQIISSEYKIKDFSYVQDPLSIMQSGANNPAKSDKDFSKLEQSITHYPIMVRPINTIIGEYIKRISQLHGFYVKNESQYARNQYLNTKTDMISSWAESQIMSRVLKKVKSQAFQPETEEFDQAVQSQTPEDIQGFMDRGYVDTVEQVLQVVLKNIWKTESLDSEFIEGFKHSCITAKEFFYIYSVNNRTKVKCLSPLDVFCHKSPGVKWVSEGQYAGFRWYLTPSSIVDLFYNELTVSQLEEIEAYVNPNIVKNKTGATGHDSISYDTKTFSDSFGNLNDHNMMLAGQMIHEHQLYGTSGIYTNTTGLIKVVRAFWKSHRKIGWLTTYDKNDNPIVEMVDENYVPKKELGEHIDFTPCNQIYTGAKIGENIYLDVKPYTDQIIDLDDLTYAPLPIEGCYMNDTNTKPFSLVDLMTPWNELYDIVAYELKEDINSSIGKVLFMSIDHLPNIPGFTMEKWKYWVKKFKIAWVKQPKTGPNTFNQFSAADMSFAQQMVAKMNILEQLQMKCDAIAGFAPNRVAGQSSEQTLGQANQQLVASVNQTEYLFFKHSKLIERVLNQTLNLAKKNLKDNKFMRNLFDDYELAYIDYDHEMVSNAKVGIYVTNSSEDLRKRSMMEGLMQSAMQNGADFADMSDLILAETISEVKQLSEKLRRINKERAKQEQQMKKAEIESLERSKTEQVEAFKEIEREKMQSNEEVAYIKTFGGVNNSSTSDENNNGMPDIMEFANFDLKQQGLLKDHSLKERKLQFDQKKHNDTMEIRKKELAQRNKG